MSALSLMPVPVCGKEKNIFLVTKFPPPAISGMFTHIKLSEIIRFSLGGWGGSPVSYHKFVFVYQRIVSEWRQISNNFSLHKLSWHHRVLNLSEQQKLPPDMCYSLLSQSRKKGFQRPCKQSWPLYMSLIPSASNCAWLVKETSQWSHFFFHPSPSSYSQGRWCRWQLNGTIGQFTSTFLPSVNLRPFMNGENKIGKAVPGLSGNKLMLNHGSFSFLVAFANTGRSSVYSIRVHPCAQLTVIATTGPLMDCCLTMSVPAKFILLRYSVLISSSLSIQGFCNWFFKLLLQLNQTYKPGKGILK